MYLSVVVPCMNEEESMADLLARLHAVTKPWAHTSEIILVDDGSTDDTWALIAKAAKQSEQVRGVRLSANRGQQVALTAGLQAATGARIFMLDADLQDPPECLPEMMALMDQGYDVVFGRREKRHGETFLKRATSHVFYRVLNALSDVPIPMDTGDFRLVTRRAVDAVLAMPEQSRFVRGMFAWAGFKQIGLEYVRDARHAGETKWPMRALMKLATDALTGFSLRPLRFATRLSFLSLIFAFAMGVYVFASVIMTATAPGWASMLLAVSFFSGIQLLTLGILGEYVGRLYLEAKRRPLYFVAEDTDEAHPAIIRDVA